MPTDEQVRSLKTLFAEALLRIPDNPAKAAFSVIADNGLALQAANLWVRDPFVIEEQKRLTETFGAKSFLANKDEQCRKVWELANDQTVDPKERLSAHRLYAEINGYIEKPSQQINVPILNQTVMVVKDHGSNDDWENRAVEQQAKLIQASSDAVAN